MNIKIQFLIILVVSGIARQVGLAIPFRDGRSHCHREHHGRANCSRQIRADVGFAQAVSSAGLVSQRQVRYLGALGTAVRAGGQRLVCAQHVCSRSVRKMFIRSNTVDRLRSSASRMSFTSGRQRIGIRKSWSHSTSEPARNTSSRWSTTMTTLIFGTTHWFRDAKFGIWAHWGPQCEPEDGDWYARNMYVQGSAQNKSHIEHYGPPSKFGFKDVIHFGRPRTGIRKNWSPSTSAPARNTSSHSATTTTTSTSGTASISRGMP